jgi:hypothetical protein
MCWITSANIFVYMAGNLTSGRGNAVSHEQRIELRPFGHACQVFVLGEIQPGVRRHVRVAPGGDMVTGGHEKGAEFQLTAHA